jgi:Xaa-Pro aminopeptidase
MRKLLVAIFLLTQLTFALDRQPNADYHMRRQALASRANAVVLVFAPTEAEGPNDLYGFRQDDNFYYLSGWVQPGAALLIAPAAEAGKDSPARPYTEILFLPAHNRVQEKWTGPKLGPDDAGAAQTTGFDRVEAIDDLRAELVRLLSEGKATVYTDVPAHGEISNSATPLEWLNRANAFPLNVSFQDVRPLLASLRTFKDAGEIELLRKAADASIAAHLAAMRTVKPGMTERETSSLMQYEWGKRGCERAAYAPIVGSSFNSTVLHYSDDSATMQAGDVVVIDAAGEFSMYASDITRTLPVSGKFTPRQREIYDIVLGAQHAAIAAFQSGKSRLGKGKENSLYDVAYNYINSHGKDSHGEPLGKYFIHGLGHYVGLNVHDSGDYNVPLGPGAVFTIEPGIYIPEEKLGVRIEDIFYVDPSGKLINFAEQLPHTADDVERVMAGK